METALFWKLFLCYFISLSAARYTVVPQFNAQDSAIIVDIEQPQTKLNPTRTATFPYYQPVHSLPVYKILQKNEKNANLEKSVSMPNTAEIFTQEEFPRDLLEIAQQKLGLKTLDEVPSITELAELLGTNNAAETISYIRQLTTTEQGIALMKAYIESSDYTDNVGGIPSSTTAAPQTTTTTKATPQNMENVTKSGFFDRMAAFLNIYNTQTPSKTPEQQKQQTMRPNAIKNLRPLYVRSPLPYHYPIPLRPVPMFANRTRAVALRKVQRPLLYTSTTTKLPPVTPHSTHLNTLKSLTPAFMQKLARIANVSPKKLEHFLQQKPKLAELAAKFQRLPITQENSPMADNQLYMAVQKALAQDEDLRRLLNATETLK